MAKDKVSILESFRDWCTCGITSRRPCNEEKKSKNWWENFLIIELLRARSYGKRRHENHKSLLSHLSSSSHIILVLKRHEKRIEKNRTNFLVFKSFERMFLDVGLLEFSNRGGKKCLRNENQWNPYDEDEKVCENFWSISNMYLQIFSLSTGYVFLKLFLNYFTAYSSFTKDTIYLMDCQVARKLLVLTNYILF